MRYLLLLAIGCAHPPPPEEPDYVETYSTRMGDASADGVADAPNEVAGADPPWPCPPCPPAGNEPPHHIR